MEVLMQVFVPTGVAGAQGDQAKAAILPSPLIFSREELRGILKALHHTQNLPFTEATTMQRKLSLRKIAEALSAMNSWEETHG